MPNYIQAYFDKTGKPNAGYDGNGWLGTTGHLQKLIKSIENYDLSVVDVNSKVGITPYIDVDKNYCMGFGVHHSYLGAPVTYTTGAGSYTKFQMLSPAQYAGKGKPTPINKYVANFWKADMVVIPAGKLTAVQQMHVLCNVCIKASAIELYDAIQDNTTFDYRFMTDYEFAALLDLVYNMGSGYAIGTSNTVNLTKLVAIHMNKKKENASAAEIENAGKAVVAQILEFKKADGKVEEGLKKRRYLDGKMYMGNTTVSYSVAGLTTGTVNKFYSDNGVSITSGGYDVTNDNRASSASVTALAMSGSSEAVQAGIFSGNPETLQDAVEKLSKDAAQKNKENADKLKSGNPTVENYKASANILHEPDVNLVTDARAMSGLSYPEVPISASSANDSISNRMMQNKLSIIGQFKKYDHVTDEDLGQSKRTKFFMTRPDMCLYQNSSTKTMVSSDNFLKPSLQCHDADLLDHLTMDRDLYIYLDRHIIPEYLDTNIAFIPAYSNQFKATNLSETNFSFNKSAANIHGVAVSIPTYDTSDTVETPLSVTFNLDDQMSVMKYNDIIYKYAKGIKEKTVLAYPEIIKYNVLDFSTTAFIFVLAQDGLTIESYYRAVGVVPASNPINTLPMGVIPEKMESFTINFKLNANLDSRKLQIINHFNFLNRMGCSKLDFGIGLRGAKITYGSVTTYDSAINWFISNFNVLEAYILDNMRASDWYCERYQIVLDTDGIRSNYKLIPIPTLARMKNLLSFITSSGPANKLFNTLINRDDSPTYQVINKNTSTYKRYSMNISAGKKNVDDQYKHLQLHLDTATKYIIEQARATQSGYHTGLISGNRSFGSNANEDGSPANIMNVFSTSTTNKRFRLPKVMDSNAYNHLNIFMNRHSPLYQASANENNPIINHVLLNQLYINKDNTYSMSESNFVEKILPSNVKNGIMTESSYPTITIGVDGIYSIKTTQTKSVDGSVSTDTSVVYNTIETYATVLKRDYSLINDVGVIVSRKYDATNNFEVVKHSKGPMYEIASRGLFLIKDPDTETDHGDLNLEAAINAETIKFDRALDANGNLAKHLNTDYYALDYAPFTVSIMGSTPYSGMLTPRVNEYGNFIERIMMYNWVATRSVPNDNGVIKYKDDILDPSKWYLDVKHSGRLYERRLKKSPIMYGTEEVKEADGGTTLRYSAYTTMAKIINTIDLSNNEGSNPDQVIIDSKSTKIISDFESTGVVRRVDINIPQGLIFENTINDLPQFDQDYFAQDGRKTFYSLMNMTAQSNANTNTKWMSFYLTNTTDGKVKYYADAAIPGAFHDSYKIQMYQFDLDAPDISPKNGKVQYDPNGMQVPISSGSTEISERATFYEWLVPDGGNSASITKNYDEDYEATSKRRLFPEALFKLELEESDVKGWKAILKNKDIILDSLVNIAKSTAKTWFYQTASNLIATAVSKLLLGDRDTKNGVIAKYSFQDLSRSKTYRDMRSNYPFHTSPELVEEQATTQMHIEEIKYIEPKASMVDIVFGYTESEVKSNLVFEPIRVTEESTPMLDILIINAYDDIAEAIRNIQKNTPSSPSDIIMNSLKSMN